MYELDIELLEEIKQLIYPYKVKGDEIIPTACPICNGGKHNDKGTFALNSATGVSNCLRGSCGWSGHINDLAEYLGLEAKKTNYFREYRAKKEYSIPEVKYKDLSKKVIDYFETRGISEETLIAAGVTSDKYDNIVFNYYRNKKITFIKYKISRKPKVIKGKKETKSWRESGAEPILYGMDQCDFNKPLIIVEGEPDKLVLDECNISNATSIPSGTQDMGWVSNCWEFLEKFDEIILWGDSDKAGKAFIQSAIVKLEDWKLKIVKTEHKDANVVLYKKGKKEVINLIKQATVVTKEYITDISDVKRKNYKDDIAIPTGFEELDKKIGGAYLGQLFTWSGYTGGGKSTFLSQLILNGLEYGKAFIYSGELPKEDIKEICDMQLSGKKYLDSNFSEFKQQSLPVPSEKYYKYFDEFYKNRLFLFDTEDYATEKEVIKAMKYMAKREDVKVFLIDNLMTVPSEGNEKENEKITKLINKLKLFARKFQVVVHLVAHPRKPAYGQKRMGKYDVSGTANIINLSDRGMGLHRLTKEEKMDEKYAGKDASTVVTFFKDRKFGVNSGEVVLGFEFNSKRFYSNEQEKFKEYDWVEKMKLDKRMELNPDLIIKKDDKDDIDKNTYEKIEVKKGLENSPF